MTRRLLQVMCALLLLPALLAVAPAASAAPAPPEDLRVTSTSSAEIPTLSWSRVPEATSYTVQVSSVSTFASTLWSATTVNINAVPTAQLPNGELWFRVRANAASGSGDWASRSFERTQEAGPTLKSPAHGASLSQPSDPVLLSWAHSPGAIEYEVEISPQSGFTDPAQSKTYKTKTTTLVRPDPAPARPYYWRVRAILATGITTQWSSSRSYVLEPLPAATLASPINNAVVEDVVLDWNPVPGATSYDVEISLVPDFSTLVDSKLRVLGTRYSPPTTLDNNQYYWRVRARDVSGNPQNVAAVSTWTFRRAWSEQPELEYPADGATVGDPFYYQWTGVRLASRYRVEVTPDPRDGQGTCTVETTQTTLTPRSVTECAPRPGENYTWSVIAFDDPRIVQTDPVAAQRFNFNYLPGLVTPATPLEGSTVEVPTLTWQPRAGASSYQIVITNINTGASTQGTSHTTSFTPSSKLATGTYRWSVRAVTEDGRVGVAPAIEDERTFELVAAPTATATTPEPSTSPGTYSRFPLLSWDAVAGASYYKIQLRPSAGVTFSTLNPTFAYPEGQDISAAGNLAAGDYVWRVLAFNNLNAQIATSTTTGRFTIAPRSAVTNRRIAMLATETATSDTSCVLLVPAVCENVSHNPVLSWDPEPNTGGYLLYLSYDRELTNLVGKNDGFPIKYPVPVYNTTYTPVASLPDSEAGTPYYWTVVPCASPTLLVGCRELEYPVNAFSKLSAEVEPVSPGVRLNSGAPIPSLPDDITFHWKDYLETNQLASSPGNGLASPSRTEARQYRIQVSTDPQFASLLDDLTVDQRTFTSFANTYPEGQLYWRVQALDGSRNPLPWSKTWTFDKSSPVPTLVGPSGNSGVEGSEPLRWHALNYASAYDVEIYRNNDTKPDASNLVDKGTIAQTAVSWLDPVEPSAQPYAWRVRRVDARNNRGGWSDWMSYLVTSAPVVLQSPASGVVVGPRESLFSWQSLPGAAKYRWERRVVGSSTTAESVLTPATAYAPSSVIADGDWEWRVVALDTAGQQLDASTWRGFSVIGAPRVVVAPAIEGTGQVGSVLTSTDPEWNMPEVVNYYQWLRSGSPIAGATTASYEVTGTDAGKSISLRVTGRRPGYNDTVTTSNAIAATAGPAPSTQTPPTISGSGRVGTTLSGTPPTWNEPDVTMTYQWLRNGIPVSWETNLTYEVKTSDLGADLTLRVTGRKSGYADAVVTSNVIKGVAGEAPSNLTPPSITGTPAVGQSLSASPGTWDANSVSFVYQWMRGGAPITGATSSSYRPVALDAGRQLSVEVRARRTGYADGVAESTAVSVDKLASTTTASLVKSSIKRSARGKVTVVVAVNGLVPLGKVQISRGTNVIAARKLTESAAGKVTVRLPRLPKGKHRLTARFVGNDQVLGSRSTRMVLKVR